MKKVALLTIVHNEKIFFPAWLRHYRKHFNQEDIFVLDHQTSDGSLDAFPDSNIKSIFNNSSFDHSWMLSQVEERFRSLLSSYDYVMFAEADEFIEADRRFYPDGLKEYLAKLNQPTAGCTGFEPIQSLNEEGDIDWKKPLLKQRKYWRPAFDYNKILIGNYPLKWRVGFHHCENSPDTVDKQLFLVHLRFIDFYSHYYRLKQRVEDLPFNEHDRISKLGSQNLPVDEDMLSTTWPEVKDTMPEYIKELL